MKSWASVPYLFGCVSAGLFAAVSIQHGGFATWQGGISALMVALFVIVALSSAVGILATNEE